MTRAAIGGIAAGAFVLGILAGGVATVTLSADRHESHMTDHRVAMGAMPMDGMSMDGMSMDGISMDGMSMMRLGGGPGMGDATPSPHESHHGSPGAGQ